VKILQLIDTLNPGGAERMCINIANALFTNGYEVVVCSTRAGGSLQKQLNQRIKCYTLEKKGFADFIAFRKLFKLIKLEKIQVIHAHSSSLFWAVFIKLWRRDLKIIWHDHLGRRINNRKGNITYKLISSYINAIISANKELANWSRHNMHVPANKVVFLNNFPLFQYGKKTIDPEQFTIVCLANILPVKDHKTLIKAINILLEKKLPKKIVVRCAGAHNDSNYFQELKSLLRKFDLENDFEFIGPVEDVEELLLKANCGVLNSLSEGLPVSLLEYGMAALPVVVTNVGQCAEVVGFGMFGKVVSPGNPKEIASELCNIITNEEESNKMGLNFREHIRENYGPETFLREYMMLLEKITQYD